MRDPDTLKELKGHIDTVNKELETLPPHYPDSHIVIPGKLHLAIKMLARRRAEPTRIMNSLHRYTATISISDGWLIPIII